MMDPSLKFVKVEVKDETVDNQVSCSHLPSSGVSRVRDADRNSHLMMSPSEDPLKIEVKEEPFDDHTFATLSPSSPQTSAMDHLSNYSVDDISLCGKTDVKEEDVWIKDEPIEDLDLIAGNTTTFTPKPGMTGNKECGQYKTNLQMTGGSMTPPATQPVTSALLPLEPVTNKESNAHNEEAAECGDRACSNPAVDTDSGQSPLVRLVTTKSGDSVPAYQCQTDDSTGPAVEPPGKKQKIVASEKLKAFKLAKERASTLQDMTRELYEKQLEVFKVKKEIMEIQLANAKKQYELEKTHTEVMHQLHLAHSEELRQLETGYMEGQY